MKPIKEAGGELLWIPTGGMSRDCELRKGDELFAQIQWRSAFQAMASAETANGAWKFKLEGFLLRQWVTIEDASSGEKAAVFHAQPSFNGSLELADGRRYSWDSNFWLTKWLWSDGERPELVRVERNLSIKAEGGVELGPDAPGCDDIPLLVVLGWYLIVLMTDLRPG